MTSSAGSRDERLALLAMAGDVFARSLDPHATLDAIAAHHRARASPTGAASTCRCARRAAARAWRTTPIPRVAQYGWELVNRLRAASGRRGIDGVGGGDRAVASCALRSADGVRRDARPRPSDLRGGDRHARVLHRAADRARPHARRARRAAGRVGARFHRRRLRADRRARRSGPRSRSTTRGSTRKRKPPGARPSARTAPRTSSSAMLGHELRNPLAPIVTRSKLMERCAPATASRTSAASSSARSRTCRAWSTTCSTSRASRRARSQLRRERVDLRDVIAKALELTQPLFERRARPLDGRVPRRPVLVHGRRDPARAGRVEPADQRRQVHAGPGRDPLAPRAQTGTARGSKSATTAVGIDASLLPHVFDLFVQGEQSIDRAAGGLGLGLAIVQHAGADARRRGRGAQRRHRPRQRVHRPAAARAGWRTVGRRQGSRRRTRAQAVTQGILVVDDNRDAATTLADAARPSRL